MQRSAIWPALIGYFHPGAGAPRSAVVLPAMVDWTRTRGGHQGGAVRRFVIMSGAARAVQLKFHFKVAASCKILQSVAKLLQPVTKFCSQLQNFATSCKIGRKAQRQKAKAKSQTHANLSSSEMGAIMGAISCHFHLFITSFPQDPPPSWWYQFEAKRPTFQE